MTTNLKQISKAVLSILAATLLVVSFQNCQHHKDAGGTETGAGSLQSGNGDGYKGKPDSYGYSDPGNACPDKDSAGHPLPNKQIDYFNLSVPPTAVLVRDNCQNLTPSTPINILNIQILSGTVLVYQNQIYIKL